MQSQNPNVKIPEDFFKRFLLQGKLISQLIAFWWRYSDDESAPEEKKEAARYLGKCFYPDYEENILPPQNNGNYKPNLIHLFAADPKRYDIENPDSRDRTIDEDITGKSNVKTLITVFGSDRIKQANDLELKKYLSPIFSSVELDNKEDAFYSFIIDNSGSKFGKLTDPEFRVSRHSKMSSAQEFRYHIPIPPRHHSIPKRTLERWIKDEEVLYPPNPHIPFTT